jgi:putative hemolysin
MFKRVSLALLIVTAACSAPANAMSLNDLSPDQQKVAMNMLKAHAEYCKKIANNDLGVFEQCVKEQANNLAQQFEAARK